MNQTTFVDFISPIAEEEPRVFAKNRLVSLSTEPRASPDTCASDAENEDAFVKT